MLDVGQLRDLIIDPTLEEINMYSLSASELVLGTGLHESRLTYLVQIDGDDDPYDDAIGLFQMEAFTHDDIWKHWFPARREIADKVRRVCYLPDGKPRPDVLAFNLKYAVAMCRIHYRRVAEALPIAGDVEAMARYHKRHYNRGGKAKISDYIAHWNATM